LISYADQVFAELGTSTHGSEADHLASFYRQTGRLLAQPPSPDLPLLLEYIWANFGELTARRGAGMAGPNPLTYQEVQAWARLTQRHPSPDEVRLLMRLDDRMLAAFRKNTPKKTG